MLSKAAPNTIFWVFGITRLGIEPWSPGQLVNISHILPVNIKLDDNSRSVLEPIFSVTIWGEEIYRSLLAKPNRTSDKQTMLQIQKKIKDKSNAYWKLQDFFFILESKNVVYCNQRMLCIGIRESCIMESKNILYRIKESNLSE